MLRYVCRDCGAVFDVHHLGNRGKITGCPVCFTTYSDLELIPTIAGTIGYEPDESDDEDADLEYPRLDDVLECHGDCFENDAECNNCPVHEAQKAIHHALNNDKSGE